MDLDQIEKLKNRNEKSWHLLYQKYSNMLFLLILRYINDNDEARSLTNGAFSKIFENIEYFKNTEDGNFLGWMKKIAVNEALMHIRKNKNLQFNEDGKEIESIHPHTADANLIAEDCYRLVLQLPEGYRVIFNLFAIEGYSHKEIAKKLGITESTSRSQLTHARAYLQKLVAEHL